MYDKKRCVLIDTNGFRIEGYIEVLFGDSQNINFEPKMVLTNGHREMENSMDNQTQSGFSIKLSDIASISKKKIKNKYSDSNLFIQIILCPNSTLNFGPMTKSQKKFTMSSINIETDIVIFALIISELESLGGLTRISQDKYIRANNENMKHDSKDKDEKQEKILNHGFIDVLKDKMTQELYDTFVQTGLIIDKLLGIDKKITITETSNDTSHNKIDIMHQPLNDNQFNKSDFMMLKNTESELLKRKMRRKLFIESSNDNLRPDLWLFLLDIQDINDIKKFYAKSLAKLDSIMQVENELTIKHQCTFDLINGDCRRTDRNVDIFKDDELIYIIERILKCFYAEHLECGYYQGMNDIVAIIISVYIKQYEDDLEMLEAISYKVFITIFEKHLKNFYDENGKQINLAFSHIAYILYTIDQNLLEFIIENSINPFMFCLPWILLMFKRIYNNYSDLYLLWDSILCGYSLENASFISCKNILHAYCAVIIKEMRQEYLKEGFMIEETPGRFIGINNEAKNCGSLNPRHLSTKVADLYEKNWLRGCDSDIFPLLFEFQ